MLRQPPRNVVGEANIKEWLFQAPENVDKPLRHQETFREGIASKTKSHRTLVGRSLAERERFELSVQVSPYDGLANRWFQPLTHLTDSLYYI